MEDSSMCSLRDFFWVQRGLLLMQRRSATTFYWESSAVFRWERNTPRSSPGCCCLLISALGRRQALQLLAKNLGISCVVAIVVCAPFYLRNWLLFGCPI